MIKYLFLPFLILFSCSSKNNRTLSEDVAAFVESNSGISYFGYVDIKSILDKSEYQSIEKFGSLIAKEISIFDRLISQEQPIFYALETSSKLEENTPLIYAFAEIKNRDSLALNIQKKGFDLDKTDAFDLHESGDIAFALTDNRVIFVSKRGLSEGRKFIEKAIENLNEDCPIDRVKEILSSKGDVVIGAKISTAFNDLIKSHQIDESHEKELKKLTKNSYSRAAINFKRGSIDIELRNYLSDQLKHYFDLSSNANNVVSKLGSGPVQAAFVMNADMKKTQRLIDQFAPNLLTEIGKNSNGQVRFAIAMLGDEGLAGLFSGKLGIALMGKPNNIGKSKPEFNFYIELGNSILPIATELVDGLGTNLAKLNLTGHHLNGFTSSSFLTRNNGLNLPKGCENFGKKPISGFINFDGIDISNFDLAENERYIKLLKYLTIEMDTEGGQIHLEVKNKKKNVLKVFVDEVSRDFQERIN
jgi:hypothetical protein